MSDRLKAARAALKTAKAGEQSGKDRLADASRSVDDVESAIQKKRDLLDAGGPSVNPQAIASEIAQLEGTAKILRERLATETLHADATVRRRELAEGEDLAAEADIDVATVEAKKKELDRQIAAMKAELGQRLKDLQSAIRTARGKVARVPEGQREEFFKRLPVRDGGLLTELMQSDMGRPDHLATVIASLMRGRL